MTRRAGNCVIGVMLLVLLALIVPGLQYYRTGRWVCAASGSERTETRWFGVVTNSTYAKSPLEKWFETKGHPVDHEWTFLSGGSRGLFWSYLESGRMTNISSFPPCLQQEFLRTATDKEVFDFLDLLRRGSTEEAFQAVDDLNDRLCDLD